MDSVKILLVLCTIVSAIGLYETATVTFEIDPVRPNLESDLSFTCEANYNNNKLKKLSILAGSVEMLSYQPDQRPRVQWSDDQTKARFDFKKELSKTRTFLKMSLKKPKCRDQNIYKCIYYQDDQEPIEEQSRVNFYVDKGGVQMVNHRTSDCSPINVTCIGQAGNPPEQMKWLKKRKGDSTFEPIEQSYIVAERMAFHPSNCSNTRVEHFTYNPSPEETDLVVKCGFGDETDHMSFHTQPVFPEEFEITALPEGQHKVAQEIQLTCSGLTKSDKAQFRWFKITKGDTTMISVTPITSERHFEDSHDMCHRKGSEMIAYNPEVNDEVIYCEVTDMGSVTRAEYHIQLGVISNPTDGITTKDDDSHEGNDADHETEGHDHMTTSDPSTEGEMGGDTKPEPGTKPEPEPETTTMKKLPAKEMSSGALRSCFINVFLLSSMLIVAIQFLLEQSS